MKKALKRIFLCLVVSLLILTTYLVGSGYSLYKEATAKMTLEEKILEIQNDENYVSIDNISNTFLQAIVSVEDHRFYTHNGIDIISIGRAVYENIKAGEIVMGGSTITQQLAKNMFFSYDKKIQRKIAELFVVYELEKNYSKDEILEMYVNIIYYGDGYYGVGEASTGYFGHEANDLTDSESILLAGLPQAPDYFALSKNYNGAVERSKVVLSSMIENDQITKDQAEEINENIDDVLMPAVN